MHPNNLAPASKKREMYYHGRQIDREKFNEVYGKVGETLRTMSRPSYQKLSEMLGVLKHCLPEEVKLMDRFRPWLALFCLSHKMSPRRAIYHIISEQSVAFILPQQLKRKLMESGHLEPIDTICWKCREFCPPERFPFLEQTPPARTRLRRTFFERL